MLGFTDNQAINAIHKFCAGIPRPRCPLRQNTDGSRLGRGLEPNSGILSGQAGHSQRPRDTPTHPPAEQDIVEK